MNQETQPGYITGSEDDPGAFEVELIREAVADPGFAAAYTLGRLLGTGASGVVFEATDHTAERLVAIKFLSPKTDAGGISRFMREGELLLSLDHPNVVRLYMCGRVSNLPFQVQELIDGGTLRERLLSAGRLPLTEAVAITVACLSGLSACHELGVVHRDIKPENVLLTTAGTVKICDLGIAKSNISSTFMTKTGTLVGSPRYMAPEQIVSGGECTAKTDLYAIGIQLYEMVTGQVPFDHPGIFEVLRAHVESEPPPLSKLVPDAPQALVDLLRRVLAKDPAVRPASAADFESELFAVLTTLPRPTRPAKAAGRAPLWLGGLVLALVGFHLSGRESPRTVVAPPTPVATVSPQIEILEVKSPAEPSIPQAVPQRCALALSKDGSLAATGEEDEIAIWDVASGSLRKKLSGHRSQVTGLSFHPSRPQLISTGGDATIRLWDLNTAAELKRAVDRSARWRGQGVVFSADGGSAYLAVTGDSQGDAVWQWDVESWKKRAVCSAKWIESSRSDNGPFIDPGARWALIAERGQLKVLDLVNSRVVQQLTPQPSDLFCYAISPDGRQVLTAEGESGTLRLWDVKSGAPVQKVETHAGRMRQILFSPDGGRAITTQPGSGLRYWHLPDLLELAGKPDSRATQFAAFSADGTQLVADGGSDTLMSILVHLDTLEPPRLWRTEQVASLPPPPVLPPPPPPFSPVPARNASVRPGVLWLLERGARILMAPPFQPGELVSPRQVPPGELPPFDLSIDRGAPPTDADMLRIGQLASHVMALSVDQAGSITDLGLSYLGTMPRLRSLQLIGAAVTGTGFRSIGVPALGSLSLHASQLGDAGLAYIGSMKGLTSLFIGQTAVTDAGLAHIARLPLTILSLANTRIGDRGLQHLKSLAGLNCLYLEGTQISDAGLDSLQGLSSLKQLMLGGTAVSEAAIRRFEARHPHCQIMK